MRVILGLAVVAAVAFAAPLKDQSTLTEQCAKRCTEASSKYNYAVGKAYTYNIRSHTDVDVPNQGKHSTNISTIASVQIAVHAPCEFEMTIKSIAVKGVETSADFESTMKSSPVRFAFDDGVIDSVCPSPDEETWALNIKLGLIAAFQNAWESDDLAVSENDVAGRCESTYRREKQGDDWVYTRVKGACRGHHNMHGAMRAQPYEMRDIETTGSQSHECRHTVGSNGILKSASCKEWHSFTPFTDADSSQSIKSTTRTRITLDGAAATIQTRKTATFSSRRTLAYDVSELDYTETTGSKAAADASLTALCQSSELYIVKETPAEFVRLVRALRGMSVSELTNIVKTTKAQGTCDAATKFLLDALPMCGSEACVKAMVEVIQTSTLSPREKSMWFTSLAFVPKASKAMIEAVLPLAEKEESTYVLLGISSLVHTYCMQHEHCSKHAPVKTLIAKLETKLADNCKVADQPEAIEKMIVTLKALGNIGSVEKVSEKVLSCAREQSNPIAIRVAAVQATRRLPCEHVHREPLMSLYRDESEDVEVRINAFMSLVKCPSERLIRAINDQLESESVHQVGSFVWSYLKERRQSDDPTQQRLTHILKQQPISRRFEKDPNQYSRYYESGKFSKSANSGAHVENGLIYTPGSYTPRAAFANLTVHMFGHSVNFLEIGGRAEGLDHFVDNLFGPEGLLDKPSSFYNDKSASDENSADYDELTKDFEQRRHYEQRERLAMSMYIRVFGDELAYIGLDDPQIMDTVRAQTDYKQLMGLLSKQRSMSVTKNLVFMDFSKSLPTSGLPVRLHVTGAVSLKLDVSGKADLSKMMKAPHDIDIQSDIRPSAAIDIATTLTVNVGNNARSGFRLRSRMHTATAFQHKLQMQQRKVFKAVLGLPQASMKLVDFEVTGLGVVNDKEIHITDATTFTQSEYCTPEPFNNGLGVKTCIGSHQPNGAHIFPKRYWVSMEKTDETLSEYEARIELANNMMPRRLSLNTPGSQIDREMSVQYDHNGKSHLIDVKVPEHKYNMVITPNEGKPAGKMILKVDDRDTYELDTEVEYKSLATGGTRRGLKAVGKKNGGEPVTFTTYMAGTMSQLHAGAKLVGVDEVPTEMTLKTEIVNGKYSTKFDWQCANYINKLHMKTQNRPSDMSLLLDAEHQSVKELYEPVSLKFEVATKKTQSGDTRTRTHIIELSKSVHPESNMRMTVSHERRAKGQKLDAEIKYGEGLVKKASADFESKHQSQHKTQYLASIAVPEIYFNQQLEANIENNLPQLLDASVEIKRNDGESRKTANLKYERKTSPYSLDAEAGLKIDGTNVDWKVVKKIEQIGDKNMYKSHTKVQWAPEHKLDVNADIKMHASRGEFDYVVDALATVTGFPDAIKVHKTARVSADKYKMAASLSRGNHAIYDVNMEVDKQSTTKRAFKGHVKSHMVSDNEYRLTGVTDLMNGDRQIDVDVHRGKTQIAQSNVILPTRETNPKKQRVYMLAKWSMDTKPEHVTFDYKFNDEDVKRVHSLTAVAKRADQPEYQLESKIFKADSYMMNNTLKVNGKERVSASWGSLLNAGVWMIDGSFKSDLEATGKVHKSALIMSEGSAKKRLLHADITCHVSNQKALVEIVSETPKPRHNTLTLKAEAGEMKSDWNFKYVDSSEKTHYAVATITEWAANKKIVTSTKINYNKNTMSFEYEDTFSTPFENARTGEMSLSYKCVPTERKCHGKAVAKLNDNALALDQAITRDDDSNVADYSLKIKKTPGTNNDLMVTIKRGTKSKDGLTMRDTSSIVQWGGDANRLRWHYTYGASADYNKAEYTALWESKVASLELDTKARYDLKIDGHKNIIEAMIKTKEDNYQINGEYDTKKNDGTIKVQTSNEELRSASLRVTRKNDNEFEITTERNGEEGATVVGTIKKDGHKRTAVLRIENVDRPLEFDVGFAAHGTDKHVKLVVTTNAGTASKKSYGMDIIRSPTKIAATVVYPKRRPHIELRAENGAYELWLQSDVNGRAPTKLIMARDGQLTRLALEDPALAHRLETESAYTSGKQCPSGADADKCYSADLTWNLKYSGNQNEKLTTRFLVKSDDESNMLIESEIKHPKSKYHQKTILRALEEGDKDIYGTSFDIENENGQTDKYNYEVVYNKATRHSSMKLRSPSGSHTVKYEKVDGEARFMVLDDATKKASYVLAMGQDGKEYFIEVRRSANADVLLHAREGLPDERTFESKMWHKDAQNNKHNDVHMKLWLPRDDLLRLRMHVQPQSWNNLIQSLASADASVNTEAESQLLIAMMKSHQRGLSAIAKGVSKEVTPLRQAWNEEREAIKADMGESLSTVYNFVWDYLRMVGDLWNASLHTVERALGDWAESDTVINAKQSYRSTVDSVSEALRELSRMMRDSYEGMSHALGRFAEHLNRMVENTQRFLDDNAYFQQISNVLSSLWETMSSWASYDDIKMSVNGWMNSAAKEYEEKSMWWNEWMDTVMDYSIVRAVYGAVQPGLDELMSFDVRAIVSGLLEYSKEIVDGQLVTKHMPKVTLYKPENGLVELEMPLPVKARSLAELVAKVEPERLGVYLNGMKKRIARIFSTSGRISDDLWESIGDTRPAKSNEGLDWSEAHHSVAYVMGDRHIVTFDGRVYGLTSQCEYLLANDFLTNKFTVSAKYQKVNDHTSVEYVKAEVRGKKIVMKLDGSVSVDGKNVELPYQYLDTFEGTSFVKVLRRDNSIALSTFDGVDIECFLNKRFCSVQLGGRFFGHSNGLLGSNDNEPMNDLHLPSGKTNTDVSAFADKWVIGRSCKATVSQPRANPERTGECDNLFAMRASPMRSCFRRIAPKAFHTMCLYNKCNAATAYIHACNDAGLSLEVPQECLTCEKKDNVGPLSSGDSVEIMQNKMTKGADVVFVVEERQCMQFMKNKLVGEVSDKITAQIGGLKNNVRYGVIGYGGEDVHFEPHFHTGHGKDISFDKAGLRKAVDALEFESSMSEGWKDPIAAINFVAQQYPFRPTVTKTVVLLTCGECGYEVAYATVQEALLQNGIRLHVYTKQAIEMNTDTDNEYIGYTAQKMFSTTGAPSEEARADLAAPHDTCTVLAQEVSGSVWSIFDEASSAFSLPAKTIGELTVAQHQQDKCEVCECDTIDALLPRTRCYPCEVPTPQSMVAPSFFNNPMISLRQTFSNAQKTLSSAEAWLL